MIEDREAPPALLDLIYDAATEADLWTSILREIARLTDSAGGLHYGLSVDKSAVFFEHMGGLSEESNRIFKARHVQNPWSLHMRTSPTGIVVASDDILPLADLQRTAFFDEVLRPQGLGHSAMVPLATKRDFIAAFSIQRGPHQGPFGHRELQFLAELTPHMRRSMQLGYRIDAYRALQHAQYRALDRLAVGVILLDRAARVLFANAAAQSWSVGDHGLRLNGGQLSHRSTTHARQLESLVRSVLRGTPIGAIGIPGGDGQRLAVIASSVLGKDKERFATAGFRDPAVMVFVFDPANKNGIAPAYVMDVYGLTLAEARVAIAIAAGKNIPETAHWLGLSPNTVKSHLRIVFGKTGARGQAELASLIAPLGLATAEQTMPFTIS
ncbi:MAG TPA: helix-turn-helix transcriptional regulator [Vineibacter sp.]|nr:helix-turn-helix transcriptional regulator [Vineibacter sp.]